jgi:hypothetical protein
MGRRDEARVDLDSLVSNDEVVISADTLRRPQLADSEAPTLAAVGRGELIQLDDAAHERFSDGCIAACRLHVDEQPGAGLAEPIAQGQQLAPVSSRVFREQPDLGERVEDQPRRSHPLELLENLPGDFLELHLRGAEDGVAAATEGALRDAGLEPSAELL